MQSASQLMVPEIKDWSAFEFWLKQLSQQQASNSAEASKENLTATVAAIIQQVRQEGDACLYAMATRFNDRVKAGEPLRLSEADWQQAVERVTSEKAVVLKEAASNIRAFAEAMVANNTAGCQWKHPSAGYTATMRFQPVEHVGCYVPGGRYPLASTVFMTALPAKAAGVKQLSLCCPNPSDEVLLAAQLAGVDAVYLTGGAQAVAAMAFGTESIPKVDMVVGPGNAYVTEAKRQLLGAIGIDMLAGPSEVTLIADASANPLWIAADLLAQAEHDPMAVCVLLTDVPELLPLVQQALSQLTQELDLPDYVAASSLKNSRLIVLESLQACARAANLLAPEHLQLHGPEAEALADQLEHYGTLFIGQQATVPYGDYAAGPNHTLPTSQTARFSGALSPFTFLRVQHTLQVPQVNPYLASNTEAFARMEGLTAHAHAAFLRQQ